MSVNLGELALATMGISPIIDGEPPKMGLGRIREAMGIPLKAQRAAARLCKNELPYEPMPRAHDYPKLLKRFSKGLQAHEMPDLVGLFPHEASDMAGAFQLVAQDAFEQVKQLFPTSTVTSFVGPTNMTPPSELVWKFFAQLEVLNDPCRIFMLAANGALLKSQAIAVHTIYPSLSELFDSTIFDAVGKAKVERLSYQLPPRAEHGVATWLGRRTVQFQAKKPDAQPPGATPPVASRRGPAGKLATTNQKAVENT